MGLAVLAYGGQPRDYVGEAKIPGPVLPLICLPTTAGTGSEVSGAAVLALSVREEAQATEARKPFSGKSTI